MRKSLEIIVTVGVIIGMVVSAMTFLAKASDVEKIEQNIQLVSLRLDYKIIGDQVYEIQKRIDYLRIKQKDADKWTHSDDIELKRLERELYEKKIQLRKIEQLEIK